MCIFAPYGINDKTTVAFMFRLFSMCSREEHLSL